MNEQENPKIFRSTKKIKLDLAAAGEIVPTICEQCGEPFDAINSGMGVLPFCDDCQTERIAQYELNEKEGEQAEARTRFNAICPVIFRETRTDFAGYPITKDREVLSWDGRRTGLLLHGETRKSKSRIMWRLIEKLIVEDLRDVLVFKAGQLETEMFEAYRNKNIWAFKCAFQCADVVAIDDFGKEKFTDRFQNFVFTTFNDRFEAGKPIIMTTNHVGNYLSQQFTDEAAGPPFVARLREFCQPIRF